MKPPLLLAAHGTRDQAGVAAFNALAERVGGLAAGDGTRVAGGFIELSPPPLREGAVRIAVHAAGVGNRSDKSQTVGGASSAADAAPGSSANAPDRINASLRLSEIIVATSLLAPCARVVQDPRGQSGLRANRTLPD